MVLRVRCHADFLGRGRRREHSRRLGNRARQGEKGTKRIGRTVYAQSTAGGDGQFAAKMPYFAFQPPWRLAVCRPSCAFTKVCLRETKSKVSLRSWCTTRRRLAAVAEIQSCFLPALHAERCGNGGLFSPIVTTARSTTYFTMACSFRLRKLLSISLPIFNLLW